MTTLTKIESNNRACQTWNERPVGSHRSQNLIGTKDYYTDLRSYRYGYETPFIPRLFRYAELAEKDVLEIGVGNGIDAVEMAQHGARYTGLDVTERHLELTRNNFSLQLPDYQPRLILGDLLESGLQAKFDVISSFGVMHHIAHEDAYYRRMRDLLRDDGVLRIAVYSKYSFFNMYLFVTWLLKTRGRVSLHDWRSHITECSELGSPVTIKIRSKREIVTLLKSCGFDVVGYHKRGFVQRYIPFIGERLFRPDGMVLNGLGSLLGWYHVLECRKSKTFVEQTANRQSVAA
jgi:2-polyprenyl-3-methyl-5-hydroxy-6-metoxy-1,4-benzoquinol methylase